MGNLTPIVRGLLIINVFVYFADAFISKGALGAYGSLWYIGSPNFQPWQFLTHMFLHSQKDFMHLLGNMMGLFFFGPWLEQTWGARNFFIFYFACGFGGAALQMGGVAFDHQKDAVIVKAELKELQEQKRKLITYQKNPTTDNLVSYMKEYDISSYNDSKNKELIKSNKEAEEKYKELKDADTTTVAPAFLAKVKKDWERSLQINKVFLVNAAKNNIKQIKNAENRINQGPEYAMLGASGAIFGILLAFALFFPNVKMMMLFFPVPIKAKYFVAIYMVFTIYAAGGGNVGMGNVAHLAHLGGALVGFILARFWLWKYRYN
jgi:membrane associated rhomboid family serine protease